MKKHEEYFADDRVIIPDYIKRMSKAELDAEIERLEEEARQKRMQNLSVICLEV